MASALNLPSDCCTSCDDTTTVNVPGATGAAGADGVDGVDGVNAFTTTTAQFVVPASGANVVVQVADSSWMGVGQNLYFESAGHYKVISKSSDTDVTVQNLGYTGNAAAAATVAASTLVSPSGIKGADGATGAAGASVSIPFTTKGDLLTYDTANARLAVGADGTRVVADSAETKGIKWDKVNLNSSAEVNGALAIANGGTGATVANTAFNALSPVTTRGDLIVRDATVNARLAIGAANTVLLTDGTDPSWAKISTDNLDATVGQSPVDMLLYTEQQTSGTAGGDFTSGAWRTRALNTENVDTGSHGALAVSQITLAAGTYRYRAWAVGYKCDNHQVRVYNVTAVNPLEYGTAVRSGATDESLSTSEVSGRFTIAAPAVIELQHRCETTRAADGLGKASGFGNVETYAGIELLREAV